LSASREDFAFLDSFSFSYFECWIWSRNASI
jgi:hypothetical protein